MDDAEIKPTFQDDAQRHPNFVHGMKGTPTYNSWQAMIQRCTDPNRDNFKHYGGRGIKVCGRWLASFENFFADMGERPDGMTLDREDTDGHYEPGNCHWIPKKQQAANRRFNHQVEFQGEKITLAELARRLGVQRTTLLKRLKLGWTHAEMIEGKRYV